jgi:hypothetical protein
MRTFIFSNPERIVLEKYLTGQPVDIKEVTKVMRCLEQHTQLLEDVYLYLQIRKTWSSSSIPEQ